MTAGKALQQRRIAIGAERTAERKACTDFPWTDRNVRMWQGVACKAHAARRSILRAYLERRAAR